MLIKCCLKLKLVIISTEKIVPNSGYNRTNTKKAVEQPQPQRTKNMQTNLKVGEAARVARRLAVGRGTASRAARAAAGPAR
jgi:hypothetical protein